MINFKKSSGFTLIEVLVATAVIALGVIASYMVVQEIFAQTFVASSRLTAAYLAKEGIEIVRNIRDTNWLSLAPDWNNNGLSAGYYQAAYADYALTAYADSYLKLGTDFYNYSTGNNTPFKRRIRIERPTADSIKITVDVMWSQRGIVQTLTVQGYLYDWR